MNKPTLLLAVFLTTLASPLLAASSDLAVTKRAVTQPMGFFNATYVISVTNYGPDAADAITVTDRIGAGMSFNFFFLISGQAPAPWVCTFDSPTQPLEVSCTHPGPIAVGNTVTLPLDISAQPGRYENCATVNHAIAANTDPSPANNRDCTCTDFKDCRDAIIDISTGTRGALTLNPGDSDDDWKIVSAPFATPGSPAKVVGKYHSGFVGAAPANWISSAFPIPERTGDYVYELAFDVGPELPFCNATLEYAADNDIYLFLDSGLIAQTVNANASAFTTLHPAFGLTTSAGRHVLRVRVNNAEGPTSFIVRGRIICSCVLHLG